MKCDHSNGYAGWLVRDSVTSQRIDDVLWVDPEANTYCAVDRPCRIVNNEVANKEHRCSCIVVDLAACTFWVTKAPVTVAPLSRGRQQEQESTGKPCADCHQPDACRRTDYCAAHRGPFGKVAP